MSWPGALIVVIAIAFSASLKAATLTQLPQKDTYVSQNNAGSNYGANTSLWLGDIAGANALYLRYDLSTIPPGSTIVSATLTFHKRSSTVAGQKAVQISRRRANWTESTVTWSSSLPFSDPIIGSAVMDWSQTSPTITDGALKTLVTEWVNNPSTNDGITILPGVLDGTSASFHSRESTTGNPVRLSVTYQPCSAPGAFTLISPAQGQVFSSSTTAATLSWNSSAGATSYDVYFGTASSPPLLANVTGTTRGVGVTAGQAYFWRVTARNACGQTAASGGTRSFSVACTIGTPANPSPADGGTVLSQPVMLDWSDVAGASAYEVMLDGASAGTTTASQLAVPASLAPGSHSWQVRANRSCGSTLGPVWSFNLQESGTLQATVLDQNGQGRASVICRLYDASLSYLGSSFDRVTGPNGTAPAWQNLPPGTYTVKAYFPGSSPVPGVEFWGQASRSVAGAATQAVTVRRQWPYVSAVRAFRNEDGWPLSATRRIAPGHEVRFEVEVENATSSDKTANLMLLTGADPSSYESTQNHVGVQVPAQGSLAEPFILTPQASGLHKFATGVEVPPEGKTDGWDWTPAFEVADLPADPRYSSSFSFSGISWHAVDWRWNFGVDDTNVTVQPDVLTLLLEPGSGIGSQVESTASDYHYGRYEAEIQAVPATSCAGRVGVTQGFFYYWASGSSLQEIDVEILSRDPDHVHFMVKDSQGTRDWFRVHVPQQANRFVTYGFDWTPTKVTFLVDGQVASGEKINPEDPYIDSSDWCAGWLVEGTGRAEATSGIPTHAGTLILNHWSGTWSGTPPLDGSDREMKVRRVGHIPQDLGTTVIVHGLVPGISDTPPEWVFDMAKASLERAGRGQILEYNPITGHWDPYPCAEVSVPQGETILVFNWAQDSRRPAAGFSEGSGEALFAALVRAGYVNKLHFVGHSRGAVVASEATERLLAAGFEVDHLTYLDPIDRGLDFFGNPFSDIDVNPGGSGTGFSAWEDIGFVDNYFSTGGGLTDGELDGRPAEGALNLDLTPLGLNHFDVRRWYHYTIDLANDNSTDGPVEDGWYCADPVVCGLAACSIPYSRSAAGYGLSRVGGGNLGQCVASGERPASEFSFAMPGSGLVNGDFERAPDPLFHDLAGWSLHGGEGGGIVESDLHYLRLDPSHTWRTHNRFYVPPDAQAVRFRLRVETADEVPLSDIDSLEVRVGDVVMRQELLSDKHDYEDRYISMLPFLGSVQTLTFALTSGSGLEAEVWIDDVSFVLEDTSPQTPSGLSPADGQEIATLTPQLSWSAYQAGLDGEGQAGYQLRVRSDSDEDRVVYDTGLVSAATATTHVYSPGTYSGFDPETGVTRVSADLENGKNYHWHVRYRDIGGQWSPWSNDTIGGHQDFTIVLPAAPAVSVNPASHDFGSVAAGASAQLSLTVRNSGTGRLLGQATTSAPFRIASGASYDLGSGEEQNVIVEFVPTAPQGYTGAIYFTGGEGASVVLNGAGVVAQQQPPVAPSWLRVTAGSASEIDLQWDDNATDETGFRVERKEGESGPWTLVGTPGANATTFHDSGLASCASYAYRVQALNNAGISGWSNEARTSTLGCSTAGPVAWFTFDSASDPGHDSANGFNATQVSGLTQAPGLVGQAGSFANGWMQLPSASALNLLAGNFTLSVLVKSTDTTNRNWLTKASTTEHRYGLGTFDTRISFSFHGGPGGWITSTSAVFNGAWHHAAAVKRGTTAEIWVDGTLEATGAINPNFTDDGAFAIGRDGMCCEWFNGLLDEAKIWSRALSAAEIAAEAGPALSLPPTAPTWLRMSAVSPTRIDLLWQDNATNESGFKIERKEGCCGPWTLLPSAPANATTYQSTGLKCGTTYAYRVWAFNGAGDTAKTNEAGTATQACP